MSLSVQYVLLGMLFFRLGGSSAIDMPNRNVMKPDMSLGIGMRYKLGGFDYAAQIPSSELGITHKLSIIGKIPCRIW